MRKIFAQQRLHTATTTDGTGEEMPVRSGAGVVGDAVALYVAGTGTFDCKLQVSLDGSKWFDTPVAFDEAAIDTVVLGNTYGAAFIRVDVDVSTASVTIDAVVWAA